MFFCFLKHFQKVERHHDIQVAEACKNKGILLLDLNQTNSAWRPRRVDAELDPGGRGKELVGEGLNTLRARLATVRARLVIVCATLAKYDFRK